jgi:hypothetical protein
MEVRRPAMIFRSEPAQPHLFHGSGMSTDQDIDAMDRSRGRGEIAMKCEICHREGFRLREIQTVMLCPECYLTWCSRVSPATPKRRQRHVRTSGLSWSPESGWQGITDRDTEAWAKAYPACDIDRQLAAMDVWLRANPERAHKSRWGRFIVNWLSRTQDRGGDVRSQGNGDAATAEDAEKLRRLLDE